MKAVLSVEQFKRYKQLSVWGREPTALRQPDAEALLELTPEQKRKISAILQDRLGTCAPSLPTSGSWPKNPADIPRLWRDLNTDYNAETTALTAEVLDERQKALWGEMIGPPFRPVH